MGRGTLIWHRRAVGTAIFSFMAVLLMAPDTEARGTLPVSVGTADTRAAYMGSSADGTRGFFRTREQLTADDTDNQEDVYERIENITTLLSKGPTGGNGALNAFFLGSSRDGLKVFLSTAEKWTANDTDSSFDIYERSGGTTTLVSTGPGPLAGAGGDMNFTGSSVDGTRVFFEGPVRLTANDTDDKVDVYERSGGTTTLISTGPLGGGGAHSFFKGASEDGTHVAFETWEPITAEDLDGAKHKDLFERSGGQTHLVSTGPTDPHSAADYGTYNGISADGTHIFFTSSFALTADDTDGSIPDVYERVGGNTVRVSQDPSTGTAASFRGASADGTRVFFTGSFGSLYERHAGTTTVVGNVASPTVTREGHVLFTDAGSDIREYFDGTSSLLFDYPTGTDIGPLLASTDGRRVFFVSTKALTPEDTDAACSGSGGNPIDRMCIDIYELVNGQTHLVSIGQGGSGPSSEAILKAVNDDGSRVYFDSAERLTDIDMDDAIDAYQSADLYPRPLSATPLNMPLVVAYAQCATPDAVHEPSLGFPSCSAAAPLSPRLTVGTDDSNGAPTNFEGFVRFRALTGDMNIAASVTDVRNTAGLSDYTGELRAVVALRRTDRQNGDNRLEQGTLQDIELAFPLFCTATDAGMGDVGSTCLAGTTANALVPGYLADGARTILEFGQLRVEDGGPDSLATTPNDTFLISGLMAP